jgi:hypothetical protein
VLIPQQASSPLRLTASAYLAPQSQTSPNAIALKNPMGMPTEIHSISWQLFAPGYDDKFPAPLGGVIGCKLDMGNHKFTNGFVPIHLFGRETNLVDAQQVDQLDVVNPYVTEEAITNSTTCFYTWVLPKPLYVPAGAVLTPSFQHFGAIPYPVNVFISASARSLPFDAVPPKTISLPWVASWMSQGYVAGTGTGSERSLETDLQNPFDKKVKLQRFGGRVMVTDTLGDNPITDYSFPQIAASQFMVRMTDSFGRPIIRDLTSMAQAFATPSRGWELSNGTSMDPESYYIVYLTKGLGGFEDHSPANINCQAQISLVGWRDEVGGEG